MERTSVLIFSSRSIRNIGQPIFFSLFPPAIFLTLEYLESFFNPLHVPFPFRDSCHYPREAATGKHTKNEEREHDLAGTRDRTIENRSRILRLERMKKKRKRLAIKSVKTSVSGRTMITAQRFGSSRPRFSTIDPN